MFRAASPGSTATAALKARSASPPPGNYTFEVIAGGTTAQGVYPQVAITVNGANRATWFLTSTNMTRYTFTIYLGVGTYTLGLAFLNDAWAPPEDRNAAFDRLTLTPETAFRIVNWSADSGFADRSPCNGNVSPSSPTRCRSARTWRAHRGRPATNFTVPGNIGSWTDTGFAGAPPLSPAAPRRFYRVRQSGP